MLLVIFPQKFTKGHLNASFQSSDLKMSSMYKSLSLNPFHYAPQGNRKMILEATTKMDKECNEVNWHINEKDRSKISSLIERVGRVNNMEEVTMTCANIGGVQVAMIDITAGKPLLFQFAWEAIRFIEEKKPGCATTLTASRISPCFLCPKSISFLCTLLCSRRT